MSTKIIDIIDTLKVCNLSSNDVINLIKKARKYPKAKIMVMEANDFSPEFIVLYIGKKPSYGRISWVIEYGTKYDGVKIGKVKESL